MCSWEGMSLGSGDLCRRSLVSICTDRSKGFGKLGWAFWDVKRGFQNVIRDEVFEQLAGVAGTRGLCT